jgi:hypothetical protein
MYQGSTPTLAKVAHEHAHGVCGKMLTFDFRCRQVLHATEICSPAYFVNFTIAFGGCSIYLQLAVVAKKKSV